MAGPVLYSVNPWISHEISMKYRNGVHFAWVSEYFDATTALAGTAAAAIAPSSNPKRIYDILLQDVELEDTHSFMITGYKKTFRRLSAKWCADGEISEDQRKEIVVTVGSNSWKIWRPVLYVISKSLIVPANRIKPVSLKHRAAYGPEMQIVDLQPHEFDLIEFTK